MFLVAVAEARDLAREAQPLAELLGVAAYDVKLWLGGALPRVVTQTASREEADAVAQAIRARGHGVLVADASTIVTGDVIAVKRLAIDDTSIGRAEAPDERLPYGSMGALVHVANRTDVEHVTREKDLVSDAAASRRPQTVVRERTTHSHTMEHVLYVFPVDALRPWVIDESRTRYVGLGAAMKPTAHENFFTTIQLLRERAQSAPYDDRFVAAPRVVHRVVRTTTARGTAPEIDAEHGDPSVHLLALWLMRGRGGPYRDAAEMR